MREGGKKLGRSVVREIAREAAEMADGQAWLPQVGS